VTQNSQTYFLYTAWQGWQDTAYLPVEQQHNTVFPQIITEKLLVANVYRVYFLLRKAAPNCTFQIAFYVRERTLNDNQILVKGGTLRQKKLLACKTIGAVMR